MPDRPDACQEITISLDPRSPLVLDVHELDRRPGTMRSVSRQVPAPSGMGSDIIGVVAGSLLQVSFKLESVVEGVLVTGTVGGRATGECGRCLAPSEAQVEGWVTELFSYPSRRHMAGSEDDDVRELEGDLIDLEPVVRDAVVLALPFQPVCRPDCPGLCSQCGARLADQPDHRHEVLDPRWAELEKLQGLAASGGDRRTDAQEEN
ncbi:MAG: YceD family protein [Angustibacter sp.]